MVNSSGAFVYEDMRYLRETDWNHWRAHLEMNYLDELKSLGQQRNDSIKNTFLWGLERRLNSEERERKERREGRLGRREEGGV